MLVRLPDLIFVTQPAEATTLRRAPESQTPVKVVHDKHGREWHFDDNRRRSDPYITLESSPTHYWDRHTDRFSQQTARSLHPCPRCDEPVIPNPGAGAPKTYCSSACATLTRREELRIAEEGRETAVQLLPERDRELHEYRRAAHSALAAVGLSPPVDADPVYCALEALKWYGRHGLDVDECLEPDA